MFQYLFQAHKLLELSNKGSVLCIAQLFSLSSCQDLPAIRPDNEELIVRKNANSVQMRLRFVPLQQS